MARPTSPPEVLLICGMLASDAGPAAEGGGAAGRFDAAERLLVEQFGPVALRSEIMPFDFTHYYDAELGTPLYRRLVAFAERVYPQRIVEAKRTTNDLEQYLARRHPGGVADADAGGAPSAASASPPIFVKPQPSPAPAPRRVVNLDPGYVEPSKLVLASMKPFAHRIYLRRGVWAEVTLLYRHGRWEALDWTFPDYASGRYDAFLTEARNLMCGRTDAGAAGRADLPTPPRCAKRQADARARTSAGRRGPPDRLATNADPPADIGRMS